VASLQLFFVLKKKRVLLCRPTKIARLLRDKISLSALLSKGFICTGNDEKFSVLCANESEVYLMAILIRLPIVKVPISPKRCSATVFTREPGESTPLFGPALEAAAI